MHLFQGAVASDVRMFRRKTIGPPFLEARQIAITFDPFGFLCGGSCIRGLNMTGVTFRSSTVAPPAAVPAPPVDASPPVGVSDFGRVALNLKDCVLDGVAVGTLSCQVVAERGVLRIEEIAATLPDSADRPGTLEKGLFTYDPRTALLTGTMNTQLKPRLLTPLLAVWGMTNTISLVDCFDFPAGPPRCEVAIHGICTPTGTVSVKTRFWGRDCRYEGVEVLRTDGMVDVEVTSTNCVVAIEPLFVVRPEGVADGGLTINSARSTVSFHATSALHPKALFQMIGVLNQGELDALDFSGPVNSTAKGSVNWSDMTQSRIEGAVRGTGLGFGPLQATDYSFTIHTIGLTNTLNDVRARVYGGELQGRVSFLLPSVAASNGTYTAEASVKNVDFQSLVHAFNRKADEEYEGRLSLRDFKLQGELAKGTTRTMTGSGALRIKNGKIFMLPIFGGLTDWFARYIPGLDFVLNQSDARTDFTMADGKMHTDKILIEGSVIRLDGNGDYHFDGHLDFRVQIKFLREKSLAGWILDLPTWILSKLFEFRLEGTREAARWQAFSSTVDLLETIGLGDRKGSARPAPAEVDDRSPPKLEGKIEASLEPMPEADVEKDADEETPMRGGASR
jgi:hypothetical protein